MAERDVVSRCVAQLVALGATHRHIIYRGRKGCPDTLFLFEKHGYACVVEFKDDEKDLRREQRKERERWQAAGINAYAVRGHDEREQVVATIRSILEKRNAR